MAALLILFVASLAFQIGYAVFLFWKTYRDRPAGQHSDLQGVSVIICAKNEAENLREFLPDVLSQKYEAGQGRKRRELPWELIVVDDASTDDTATVLEGFRLHPRLRVVTVPPDMARRLPGKKLAMQHGVAAARHPWILCTDADCAPAGDDWLRGMVNPLIDNDVAIGYGLLEGRRSLLSGFIQGETLHAFVQAAAFANAGMPSSAVGRNLAFRNDFYQEQRHGAFDRLPSGDDDLLLHGPVRPRVAVVRGPGWMTCSAHPDNLRDYLRQKRRHLSTGKYYRPRVKALLGSHALSHSVFWITAVSLIGLATGWLRLAVVSAVLLRWLAFSAAWNHNQNRLGLRRVPWFLWFDLGWLLYNAALSPYILWKNKQAWK